MKYFVLSFLLTGFIVGLPVSFGEQMPPGFQVYTSDGKLQLSYLKVGEEIRLEDGVYNNATLTSIGNIKFYIRDAPDGHKDMLKTYDFSIKSGESEKFSTMYTPAKTGYIDITVDISYLIPQGKGEGSGILFTVVDDFGKAFAKNNHCKEGFAAVIKPNYSSIVCVSEETSHKLAQRWNS